MNLKTPLKFTWPVLLAAILSLLITFQVQAQSAAADEKKVDAAIQEIYSTISGPAGKVRDWQRWKDMFATDAKMGVVVMGKDGQTKLRFFSPEEFIRTSGKYMEEQGFFEKEIHRETEQFGHLVQVFSTYEGRTKETDSKPLMRGINTILLVEEAGKLKIASLIWEQETTAILLPAKYLPLTK